MIFGTIEPCVEVINLILAFAILIVGMRVLFSLAVLTAGVPTLIRLGSEFKKIWNFFFVAILFFGVHETIGILAEFGIFEIEGLYAFTEFLFILALLVSTFALRRLLSRLLKLRGKGRVRSLDL